MIDGLDGGVELKPLPARVKTMRLIAWAVVATNFLFVAALLVLSVAIKSPGILIGSLGYLIFMAATDWLVWRFLRPPDLRADAIDITYRSGFTTQSMPRGELTMIYQGQVVQRARYTAWVQSYLFAISNGEVRIKVPAWWYSSEDIHEFAQRLGVPVRGDFTQRVQGTVSERP